MINGRKLAASVPAVVLSAAALGEEPVHKHDSLDVVVVSAQRVKQELQKVPVAVSVFTGEFMQTRQVVDFENLVVYMPGLNVTTATRTLSQPVIRGASSDDDAPGVDLAVGLFVDDVFLGRNIDFSLDMFDIERVEVLRGPQGTLFGRNVTGGLLNIQTKNPTYELGGSAEVTLGSHNRRDFRGVLNAPLIDDKIALRMSVSSRNADGAIPNRNGPDLLQDDQDSFRGKLLYTPNDSFRLLLAGHYLRDRSIGVPRDIIAFGENLLPSLAGMVDLDERVANVDAAGGYDRTVWGISARVEWDISFGELTSITAWHENHSDLLDIDVDATPALILGGPGTNDAEQLSQELRHSYTSEDGRLSWIGGLYYLDVDFARTEFVNQIPYPGSFLGLIGLPPIGGSFAPAGFFDQRIETRSHSVFGQLTYALHDKLRLTVGGRYTRDEKEGFTADSGVIQRFNVDVAGEWSAFTPRFAVDYDLSEDVLLYASATRGFKSGGFSSTTTRAEALEGFAPELAWSYELGLKSRFLDDRLQANIAAFTADYEDLQFRSGTVGTSSFVGNAGKASITGIESEFQWVATDRLFLFLNYAWQDGEYDELMIGTTDYSGNALALTPENSLSTGLSLLLPLGRLGDLTFRGDYQYKSATFLNPEQTPGAVQKIDGLVNASVSLEFLDGRAQLTVFGKNLTDETFITRANRLSPFLGRVDFSQSPPFAHVMTGSFNEPRRWGVSLSYQF